MHISKFPLVEKPSVIAVPLPVFSNVFRLLFAFTCVSYLIFPVIANVSNLQVLKLRFKKVKYLEL